MGAQPGGAEGGGGSRPVSRRDFTPEAAKRLLLGLGGLLLAVAAVVFAVVTWGTMGIGGRALILMAITAGVAYVPRPLLRRDLDATAETLALLAVVLFLVDGYSLGLWAVGGSTPNPYGVADEGIGGQALLAATVSVFAAVTCALYGRVLPLRTMPGAALLFAQLPLPLLALAADSGAAGVAVALTLNAALDLLVARPRAFRLFAGRAPRTGYLVVAGFAFLVCWLFGALAAGQAVLTEPSHTPLRLTMGGTLLAGALLGALFVLHGPFRTPRTDSEAGPRPAAEDDRGHDAGEAEPAGLAWWRGGDMVVAVAATLMLVAAPLAGFGQLLPRGGPTLLAGLAVSACVPAVLAWMLPAVLRTPVTVTGMVLATFPVPFTILPVLTAIGGGLPPEGVWSGAGGDVTAWAVRGSFGGLPGVAEGGWPVALGAAGLAWLCWARRERGIAPAYAGAGLVVLACLLLPFVLHASSTQAMALDLALFVALLLLARWVPPGHATAVAGAAYALATIALGPALAERGGTYAALGVITIIGFAGAAWAKPAAALTLSLSPLAGGALAWALLAGQGLAPADALSIGLATAALLTALTRLVATRLTHPKSAAPEQVAVGPGEWSAGPASRWQAWGLAAVALVPVLSAVVTLAAPLWWASQPWTGAPESAREALSPYGDWPARPALIPVLLLIALTVTLTTRRRVVPAACGAVAILAAPLAADLRYEAALATAAALTLAALTVLAGKTAPAGQAPSAPGAAGPAWDGPMAWVVVAGAFGAIGLGWSLAEQWATLVVLGVYGVALAGCAALARLPVVRAWAAPVAVAVLVGEALASGLALGWRWQDALAVALGAGGVLAGLAQFVPAWRNTTRMAGPVLAVAAPLPLFDALVSLAAPYLWVGAPWAGAPAMAREALGPGIEWPARPFLLPVICLTALGLTLVTRRWAVLVGGGAVALLIVPLAADLPYGVAVGTVTALAVATIAAMTWIPQPPGAPSEPAPDTGAAHGEPVPDSGAVPGGVGPDLKAAPGGAAPDPRGAPGGVGPDPRGAPGGVGPDLKAGRGGPARDRGSASDGAGWAFGGGAFGAIEWVVSVGAVLGSLAVAWSLAERVATLVVLGVFAVAMVACAALARSRAVRGPAAVVAVSLVGGEILAAGLAAGWSGRDALAVALGGGAVLAALAALVPYWRRATSPQALVLAGLALLPVMDALLAMLAPYVWLSTPWAGAPESAREALSPYASWPARPLSPVILAASVLAAGVVLRSRAVLVAGAGGVLLLVPLAADLSYAVAVGTVTALTIASLAIAARIAEPRTATGRTSPEEPGRAPHGEGRPSPGEAGRAPVGEVGSAPGASGRPPRGEAGRAPRLGIGVGWRGIAGWWAAGAAGVLGTLAVAWSMAEQTTTLVVAGVLAVAAAGCAMVARAGVVRAGAMSAALALAVGEVLAAGLAAGWRPADAVAVAAATGAVLAAGAQLRAEWRTLGRWQAVALAGVAPLPLLDGILALAAPYLWATEPWTGAPESARAALAPQLAWPDRAVLAPVLVLVTAALTVVLRRSLVLAGGAAAVLLVAPLAADLPYEVAVGTVTGLAVAAIAVTARRTEAPWGIAAPAVAAVLGPLALAWSLAEQAPTLLVLGVLAASLLAAAALARSDEARAGTLTTGLVLTAAEALTFALVADRPVTVAGLGVLGVAIAAALMAWPMSRSPRWASTAPYAEITGAALAALGLLLTTGDLWLLHLGLTATGVALLAVALRPERRGLWYAGAGVLLCATWLRLGLERVEVIEAYVLPFAALALLIGWLMRRAEPSISSWLAYGPGLGVAMLPSLVVALDDPGGMRPLLLGAGALLVTVLGVRYRLQAPALLGAAVLVTVVTRELAPRVAELVGAGPRWAPIAVGGALLLFLGATFEGRMRDLRTLRGAIGRMD